MLSDLLLDVRFHIASFDEEVWYLFYKHFDDFKLLSLRSISLFAQLFTKKILLDDRIEYRLLGYLHCDSGPAIINNDHQFWYQHGQCHRDDDPAIICTNGKQHWYQHGLIHRDNGPAIIDNGNQYWYQHGQLHRNDGPAIIYADGEQQWYQHGELHRDDGPAVIDDDEQEWYQHGKLIAIK